MCSIARGGGPGTAGGRPPWLRRKLLGRTRVRVGAGLSLDSFASLCRASSFRGSKRCFATQVGERYGSTTVEGAGSEACNGREVSTRGL